MMSTTRHVHRSAHARTLYSKGRSKYGPSSGGPRFGTPDRPWDPPQIGVQITCSEGAKMGYLGYIPGMPLLSPS